jgi:hypothetical protein
LASKKYLDSSGYFYMVVKLVLPGATAFNASMDRIYENQQPNEERAYDEYIQNLGDQVQDPRQVMEQVRLFAIEMGREVPRESLEAIGQLICGAIGIPEEMMDDESVKEAKRMLLFGAMTGLYIGKEMMDGYMSNEEVLATSRELMKDRPSTLLAEADTFVHQMNPITKNIVDGWKLTLDPNKECHEFFDKGFGTMMCSVNKTMYEIDLFRRLENDTDWVSFREGESEAIALQSLDDDCMYLAKAFYDHSAVMGLNQLPAHEQQQALDHIAKLLNIDLAAADALTMDDQVQTRGSGICINFDENGNPDDVCEYDDDLKVRGNIISIECMPVPTEFSLIMGIREGDDIFEPQLCLVLDNIELIEPDGSITTQDGTSAIPLRLSGTQLDKLIYQA